MNKLIKGMLVMTNVADKDVDMYVKSGWKLEKTKHKVSLKKANKKDDPNIDELLVSNVENSITSDTIQE